MEEHFLEDPGPKSEIIKKLLRYIMTKNILKSARYPPSLSADMTSSPVRTSNACEFFHSKFNRRFYVANPNIFLFLSVLNEVQLNTEMTTNAAKRRIQKATKFIEQKRGYLDNMIKSFEKK